MKIFIILRNRYIYISDKVTKWLTTIGGDSECKKKTDKKFTGHILRNE